MTLVKVMVLTSTLLATASLNALAQSGSPPPPMGAPPPPAASGTISPATHCIDSNDVVRLRSEAQRQPGTVGSAVPPPAVAPTPRTNAPGGNPGSALSKC
jgi:hypothetical protein